MAEITLSIILDKPGRVFEWGEAVTGQVKVTVEHNCPAAALMAVLYCKGLSESKEFKATVERETIERNLFKGVWTAGAYSYSFEIVVPHGPFTYRGHIFNATWHVGARARASGGEDIKAETEITVLAVRKEKKADGPEKSGEVVYTQTARSLKGLFGFSFVLFLAGLFVGWRNSPFAEGTNGNLFFFGGVILMVLGLALLFCTVMQALVNKRIKKVEVRLGSTVVRRGEQIPCSLTFQANLPFEVEKITATLTAEEIVHFRHSSSKGNRGFVLYEAARELPLAVKQVPANIPVRVQGDVPVPEDIPCSIDMMKSDEGMAVRWRLDLNIGMKNWPDWLHLEDITVVS